MSNRLADETSPYLLQHAENPVDWYPWGPEALEKSRSEDRPIFLSIGYSACHWCHVMEHESFENEQLAQRLNQTFVNIKVDREERPDLDQIYMHAVQALTGHGGWPMSVFLTPQLEPFYGGTYWPPTARRGMPGFDQVISAVAEAWNDRREDVHQVAQQLTGSLQSLSELGGDAEERLAPELLQAAEAGLSRQFDSTNGGFGGAPKFPHPMDVQVLLRCWQRRPRESVLQMVTQTLDKMAAGGIYDHLGGGFHRYSVDARWLVPHFEKMLYDNALLAGCYLDGYLATGDANYARVVQETLDYVLRDMTDPLGGFYSTEDADSEGEEGKFYVWTPEQTREVLGEQVADRFNQVYDVTPGGNFEGNSILNLPRSPEQVARLKDWDLSQLQAELAEARTQLLAVRGQRVPPGKDDKVLLSWNALCIDSLARAAGPLGRDDYLQAACKAASFLLTTLRREDDRLLHSWRHGVAKLDAYLDDYAYLTNALVSLYEASCDPHWIEQAARLAEIMLERFADPDRGGFFFTADDHEALIARTKDVQDSSVPSGNSMAATALLRLGKLTGNQSYWEAGERTLLAFQDFARRALTAMGQMLQAVDFYFGPTPELVLTGATDEVLQAASRIYLPNKVLAARTPAAAELPDDSPLKPRFEGRPDTDEPTLYVCQNFACQAPVAGEEAVLAKLRQFASPAAE